MKHSVETHAARLAAWQTGQVTRRRGRSKAFLAKKRKALARIIADRYRKAIVAGKAATHGTRPKTKAPHSKDRRRRRAAIAKASRRANR